MWHPDVADEDVREPPVDGIGGFRGRADGPHPRATELEHGADRFARIRLVIDEEHVNPSERREVERTGGRAPSPGGIGCRVPLPQEWELHDERRALSLTRALRLDRAAVQLHQVAHDR